MSMPAVAAFFVGIVAAIHVVIAVVEMLFWTRPRVHRRLDFTLADAQKVAPIVANAGLYNSFLAAGLIWALASAPGVNVTIFFLLCVIVAGLFGAATLNPKKKTTLYLQTLPAAAALVAVLAAR
jgi:putative membrane protein